MTELESFLSFMFFGNPVSRWGIAIGIALVGMILLLTIRRIVRNRYAKMRATEQLELLEVPFRIADRTTLLFLLVVAIAAGVSTLELDDRPRQILTTIVTVVFCLQLGLWLSAALMTWLERRRDRTVTADRAAAGTFTVLAFIGQLLVWTLVLLLTLDNLGINITALVAGLGIGGVAVALAVQNILGDLLASLSITLDKPFVVGDFLGVGEFLGSVEYIGIKSTRLRSLTGEQIIMPNADLLASRVRNHARMSERRVVFTFTVTYDTRREQLEQLPARVRAIVESEQPVRFDRCHFLRFGTSGFDFEVVYFVLSPDYNLYMDIQQRINLAILEYFEERKIAFAYPTQRLLVDRIGGDVIVTEENDAEHERRRPAVN